MEIYVKKYLLFPYLSFFLIFKHNFIKCVDFTLIAASHPASDDVTNYVTHIFFAHFMVEIDDKSSLNKAYFNHTLAQ